MPASKRGGKREGAGRKPATFPLFLKKLRANELERREFMDMLSGDARNDFLILFAALKKWKNG
jgi:hypothetical protein